MVGGYKHVLGIIDLLIDFNGSNGHKGFVTNLIEVHGPSTLVDVVLDAVNVVGGVVRLIVILKVLICNCQRVFVLKFAQIRA